MNKVQQKYALTLGQLAQFKAKQEYHQRNKPGDKKESSGRQYTIHKDGSWRRDDMSVTEKRVMFHIKKKERKANARKQRQAA